MDMTSDTNPLVGVIMGSQSDWETMAHASSMLTKLGVAHECRVVIARQICCLKMRPRRSRADFA